MPVDINVTIYVEQCKQYMVPVDSCKIKGRELTALTLTYIFITCLNCY